MGAGSLGGRRKGRRGGLPAGSVEASADASQRRKLGSCDIFVHVHAFLLVIQVVVDDCNSCKYVIHGL
jgi:hypothetical protein